MKWPWIVLTVGAAAVFGFFMLTPPSDDGVCNFCSGSGQGEDCPRHDAAARVACLDSVHWHYCGQSPGDCG